MTPYMESNFQITELVPEDAGSLSELMIANADRFKPYFPHTLAQNLSFEASRSYISQQIKGCKSRSEYTWVIKEMPGNVVAGLVILKKLNWRIRRGELAYCIGAAYEGRGWVTQAVKELSNLALGELGMKTLQIIVHKDNLESVKVARKSGYTWKKTLKKQYTPPERAPQDMELYERRSLI